LTILSNWPCCGLAKADRLIRPTLKATSSGVSVLPSWKVTPSRIWNSTWVSDSVFQAVAICGTIAPWSSRVTRLSKMLR